jgi:hypothetical protein
VLAFKALLAADTTYAKSKQDATAKGLASGAYTFWWQSAAGIGAATTPVITSSFQACLTACDSNPTCAAVAMTGVTTSKAPVQACSLIKGDSTLATFQRSVTKVNTSRLVLPAVPDAATSGELPQVAGPQVSCKVPREDLHQGKVFINVVFNLLTLTRITKAWR